MTNPYQSFLSTLLQNPADEYVELNIVADPVKSLKVSQSLSAKMAVKRQLKLNPPPLDVLNEKRWASIPSLSKVSTTKDAELQKTTDGVRRALPSCRRESITGLKSFSPKRQKVEKTRGEQNDKWTSKGPTEAKKLFDTFMPLDAFLPVKLELSTDSPRKPTRRGSAQIQSALDTASQARASDMPRKPTRRGSVEIQNLQAALHALCA